VDLNHLHVHEIGADCFRDLDAVSSAVVSVGSGQVKELWAVFLQEGVVSEIGSKASSSDDDAAMLFEGLSLLFVLCTNHRGFFYLIFH